MTLTSCAITLLLAAGADPAAPSPEPATLTVAGAPALDPAALAAVRKMSDKLSHARTFTFRARVALELPTESGALGTYFTRASVAIRRPDGLAATRGGDLPEMRFAYDGKAMTVLVPGTGKWGSAAAPPTLDDTLVAAFEQGGLSFPADELIVADPYAAITRGMTLAARVVAPPGAKKTEHVVLAGPELQLELWIDPATDLPSRAAVTYVDHPLRPHFAVEYSDWKIDPALPASTFALPRPPGATDVGFKEASSAFR